MEDNIMKELFKAARQNLFKDVVAFIEEKGVPSTTINKLGRTLGHVAVLNSNFDMFKYVVDKDPSILRIEDKEKYNIFHMAVKQGTLDMVKHMIEKYNEDILQTFPPDICDTGTALHQAVKFGHTEMVKYFIGERNLDVNGCVKDQKQPPLFLAVEYKHPDIVNYLVDERNANLTLIDQKGENVLFPAVHNGDLNLIKHLLDVKRAPIDIDRRNHDGKPLILKVVDSCAGNVNDFGMLILRYLVEEKNIKVNIRVPVTGDDDNKVEEEPLLFVVFRKELVFKYLVQHGADVNALDACGRNLLYKNEISPDLCSFLVERGIDVNRTDSEGKTPLSKAIETGSYELFVRLYEGGADWKRHMNLIVDKLDKIYLKGYFSRMKATLDVNTPDQEGRTLLHYAGMRGRQFVCGVLLGNGAQINLQDNLGNTALHYAAEAGQLQLCKSLVGYGANSRVRNNCTQIPLELVPAGNETLKNFLRAADMPRRRRNVGHYFSPTDLPRLRTLGKYGNENDRIAGGNSHLESYHRGGGNRIVADVVSPQLQNWLLFAQLLFRNAMGGILSGKWERASSIFFSESRTTLTSRMDPVAEQAIRALPDIEELT